MLMLPLESTLWPDDLRGVWHTLSSAAHSTSDLLKCAAKPSDSYIDRELIERGLGIATSLQRLGEKIYPFLPELLEARRQISQPLPIIDGVQGACAAELCVSLTRLAANLYCLPPEGGDANAPVEFGCRVPMPGNAPEIIAESRRRLRQLPLFNPNELRRVIEIEIGVAARLRLTPRSCVEELTSLDNREKSITVLIPEIEDLSPYKVEAQPWYTPLPQTKELRSDEMVSLADKIDIVLLTATVPELEAVLRLLDPYPRRGTVLQRFVEQETYYLGKFGAYLTAVTKCRMGSLDSGAAALATQHAQRVWRPRAFVMAGIALGKDPIKQKIADVLIASQIISYEPQRIGEKQTIPRGPITPSNTTLLNRFENVLNWSFHRPDGSRCECHVGPLLSGEKLVDDPTFKASLFSHHPQAIGGEMEGVGLAAAAVRHGVPWILVKAICDWGDGKKHKKHQPLAAAAAVSLVHHVLSQIDVLHGLAKPNRS